MSFISDGWGIPSIQNEGRAEEGLHLKSFRQRLHANPTSIASSSKKTTKIHTRTEQLGSTWMRSMFMRMIFRITYCKNCDNYWAAKKCRNWLDSRTVRLPHIFTEIGHASQILKVNLTNAEESILFNKHIIYFALSTENTDGMRADHVICLGLMDSTYDEKKYRRCNDLGHWVINKVRLSKFER